MKRFVLSSLCALLVLLSLNTTSVKANGGPVTDIENFYTGQNITAVTSDSTKTWIAISGTAGVQEYANSTWSDISVGLGATWVQSLEADGNGGVWAGHFMNGTSHYNPSSGWSNYISELASSGVSAIKVDGTNVYVGHGTFGTMGQGGGFSQAVNGTWSSDMSNPAPGLISNNIADVETLTNNEIWIAAASFTTHFGSYDGGIAYFDGSQWINTSDSLGNKNVKALESGPNDTMFAATASGIYQYDRATGLWSLFGLDGIAINDIAIDVEGNVWATTESGIEVYQDGVWYMYSVGEGLAGDSAQDINIAENGDVWVATTTGLSRISVLGREATAVGMLTNGTVIDYNVIQLVSTASLALALASSIFLIRKEMNRPALQTITIESQKQSDI